VAEVPEHLLKRAAARRAALEGKTVEADDTGATAAATALSDTTGGALAKVSDAVPATTIDTEAAGGGGGDIDEPAAPELLPEDRDRIPGWAIPALMSIPIFVLFVAAAFDARPNNEPLPPLELGAQVWISAGCSGCHGAQAGGGVGPALADGEVLKTFPTILATSAWTRAGSPGVGIPYGNPDREGGQRISGWYNGGQMPAFGGTLSEEEIVGVSTYVHVTFGGGEETDE